MRLTRFFLRLCYLSSYSVLIEGFNCYSFSRNFILSALILNSLRLIDSTLRDLRLTTRLAPPEETESHLFLNVFLPFILCIMSGGIGAFC